MRRRPPETTRPDALFPYTALFRAHGPWGGGRRRILQDGGASTGPKATGRRNVIPGGPASTASFLPLPCLCIAAEAAPAGVCGQSQGELEIVDQAGAAQPRGDEGDAPTRAVFRLVQVTISHDRIVDREARRLQRLARLRLDRKSTRLNSS